MIDPTGTELPDQDAAHEEARRRAYLLLSEGYQRGEDCGHWILEVCDELGEVVLSMSQMDASPPN
jgi:uncharacterized protein DUF6894